MYNLGEIRPGFKIIFRDAPHEVVEANHLKMGRGGAKLVTKLRNLLNQSVYDYTFAGDERLEEANISYKAAQFLYSENNESFFMTNDDFETISLTLDSSRGKFLKEGEAVDLMFWKDSAIDVKIPKKVTLKITYTEPGFKGNTASSVLKPATTETGAQIMVPLFISSGDIIKVNTETGEYDSRVAS